VLKVRVIPTLLWKGAGLAKGVGFDSWRRVGSVVPAVKVYNAREVDELILVDIEATEGKSIPDLETISDFSDDCFVPLTVGGGITSLDHITALLRAGADKITLNSSAFSHRDLINQSAMKFGSQCIVVSIDVKKESSGQWMCYSHAGKKRQDVDALSWAKEVTSRGAGEILLTSIDRDGTMTGYDLELIAAISSAVRIPVIASGGAGSYEHMVDAVKIGGASAVAAASIFHFTELTPKGAKDSLQSAGIPVRRPYAGI
jgi:cyclase